MLNSIQNGLLVNQTSFISSKVKCWNVINSIHDMNNNVGLHQIHQIGKEPFEARSLQLPILLFIAELLEYVTENSTIDGILNLRNGWFSTWQVNSFLSNFGRIPTRKNVEVSFQRTGLDDVFVASLLVGQMEHDVILDGRILYPSLLLMTKK